VADAVERIDWRAAEPALLVREREEMARRAPEMELLDEPGAGVWRGLAPHWPIDLEPPEGLDRLLAGGRLQLEVAYTQGFPMAPPVVFPLDPEPAVKLRARHDWHLNGDGSLCLLWSAADWPGTGTAADLVEKASGWFAEYLALLAGLIDAMSQSGPFYGHSELAEKLRSL
jgi:hypothetical protein